MFMLLNRDLQWPYQFELDQLQNKSLEGSKKELVGRFTQQMKPTFSNNYCILQATEWLKVDEIFAQCTKFAPSDRPSAEQILARLQVRDDNRSISHDIPMNVSQSTAVEGHDRLVAVSAASGGDILNDATNGCALLAVGIADQLMQEPTIVLILCLKSNQDRNLVYRDRPLGWGSLWLCATLNTGIPSS